LLHPSKNIIAKFIPVSKAKPPAQTELHFKTRGGHRENAGRPRSRTGVSHGKRPHLASRHPVHVTLKVRPDLPTLRSRPTLRVFWRAACAAREKSRSAARLVHYSVQHDHVHLLVEAPDREALSRGIQGLAIRLARGINKELGRTGRVFADRYHARTLRTPLEVRRALAYVLLNARRHAAQRRLPLPDAVDPCTSAAYFDGFREGRFTWKRPHTTGPPVTPPRTWLLSTGWRRHGELSITEVPGGAARSSSSPARRPNAPPR
jgi:REP element-mobilizing transposase RayT